MDADLGGVAFSPDGRVLAVGYYDAPVIDLFDSRNLSRLQGPDLADLVGGTLNEVSWSLDGKTLYAAGLFPGKGPTTVLSWERRGYGKGVQDLLAVTMLLG